MIRSLPFALLLAACGATTPPPAVELRTVTVDRPVPVRCIDPASIPAEPKKIAGSLTGDARRDLDRVAASALELRSWGRSLRAMMEACGR
jgi:hypothetical protein